MSYELGRSPNREDIVATALSPQRDLWAEQKAKMDAERAARESAHRATPLGQAQTLGGVVLSLAIV